MDDVSLLQAYADRGDQDAFARLVHRHGNWLYSAARRQLGDTHLAEDVTQAVFLLLARRAGRLRRYAYLSGWLSIALGYCVRQTRERQAATRRREQEVATMRPESVEEASWDEVGPLLERAVGRLGKADRDAILLRFYEQRPLAEVSQLMGTSEEAAKKRVQRAVVRLRGMLERQGVTSTSAGLSAVLVGNVVQEMPGQLVGSVMAAIGGGGSGVAGGIAEGAMKMMAVGKAAGFCLALVLVAGIGVAVVAAATAPSGDSKATATDAAPAAKDLAAMYGRATGYARRIVSDYEWRFRRTVDGRPDAFDQQRQEGRAVTPDGWLIRRGQVRRDAARLDVIQLKQGIGLDQISDPAMHDWRDVLDGKGHWYRLVGRDQVAGNGNGQIRRVGAVIKQPERTDVTPMQMANEQAGMEPGGLMDGFLPFVCTNKTLAEVMRDANDLRLAEPETVEGHQTNVLECTDGKYRYTVWLDANLGYQARRIRIASIADESLRQETVLLAFASVSGFHVPEYGVETTTWTNPKHTTVSTSRYQRSNVNLAPDFAGLHAFTMEAPVGFMLQAPGFPEMRWRLVDGEFVPLGDGAAVKGADRLLAEGQGQSQPPDATKRSDAGGAGPAALQGRGSWWLWIAAGVAFVAGGATIFALMRRRGGGGPVAKRED